MSYLSRCTLALIALVAILLPVVLLADIPRPDIPEAEGECVEPESVMRTDHMKFILHQRNETVHQGIRTSKYSLKECINCHVQPDEQGHYPEITSKKHFCNACHSYAAVKIDCFQCHVAKPEQAVSTKQPSH